MSAYIPSVSATPERGRAIPNRDVARALPSSLLWSYASILAAAVLLAAVGILAFAMYGGLWIFDRGRPVAVPAWEALSVAAWVAGPVALAGAVWGAAYASTLDRSVPRTMVGTVVALMVGAGLLALGSSGFAVASLAMGWAIAIPSDSFGRVGARGLVPVFAALALLAAEFGRIRELRLWQVMVAVGLSPLLAALWVWVSDALWTAAAAARSGGD